MVSQIEQSLKVFSQRGVSEFIDPDGKFGEKLLAKARGQYPYDLNIKFGVDPTRPDIHLGHTVILRKLRELQDWGCRVIFVIGDYTVQVGDPSGRTRARPELSTETIEANLKTYLAQVSKILLTDKKVFTWIRNSDWYTNVTDLQLPASSKINFRGLAVDSNSLVGKALVFEQTRMQSQAAPAGSKISVITLRGFLWTLKHLTYARLIERDLFQERLRRGGELYLHEMMYPVLQGIDSHVLANIYGHCDLEVGGSDQIFNMLMGREVMRINQQAPQAVLALRLLEGLDGKEKMSKSLNNYIGVAEPADQMYGKVMSLPDSSIVNYFELATYAPLDRIDEIKKQLKQNRANPMIYKSQLAKEIVAIYHGEQTAAAAQENFAAVFRQKKLPRRPPTKIVQAGTALATVLLAAGLVRSKSELRRLIAAGAIEEINGPKIDSADYLVNRPLRLRIGKKKFLAIRLKGR